MAPRPESQERQASATGRYLDTANRCLVRQLRVLSRIGRHPAAVKLAEAVFKTMLETQETMVQTHELLTHTATMEESFEQAQVVKATRVNEFAPLS